MAQGGGTGINTTQWCSKLILDCFFGFEQNSFVEGKKTVFLIILGNSFQQNKSPLKWSLQRQRRCVSHLVVLLRDARQTETHSDSSPSVMFIAPLPLHVYCSLPCGHTLQSL